MNNFPEALIGTLKAIPAFERPKGLGNIFLSCPAQLLVAGMYVVNSDCTDLTVLLKPGGDNQISRVITFRFVLFDKRP